MTIDYQRDRRAETATPEEVMGGKSLEKVRVLLIDPEQEVHEAAKDTLKYADLELVCAYPTNGLQTLGNNLWDLIIIEVNNPLEQHQDLLNELNVQFPQAEWIFLSRQADDRLWMESIQRGAYDLLPKPLDRVEFKRVVFNAITRRLRC